jgi:hypothetical protein
VICTDDLSFVAGSAVACAAQVVPVPRCSFGRPISQAEVLCTYDVVVQVWSERVSEVPLGFTTAVSTWRGRP